MDVFLKFKRFYRLECHLFHVFVFQNPLLVRYSLIFLLLVLEIIWCRNIVILEGLDFVMAAKSRPNVCPKIYVCPRNHVYLQTLMLAIKNPPSSSSSARRELENSSRDSEEPNLAPPLKRSSIKQNMTKANVDISFPKSCSFWYNILSVTRIFSTKYTESIHIQQNNVLLVKQRFNTKCMEYTYYWSIT